MITITPSCNSIVKNYFLKDGDTGKVVLVEKKEIESIPRDQLNYITQIEVGPYNMNQRFSPGSYYFIWVEFSKYIRHLFISHVNPNTICSGGFFLNSEVQVKFDDPNGFVVW